MKVFRKMLSFMLVTIMVIGIMGINPVTVKAEDGEQTVGNLTMINGNMYYNLSSVHVFADADSSAGNWQWTDEYRGTYKWFQSILLEFQEDTGTFVVIDNYGVNSPTWGVDNTVMKNSTLGPGRIVVAWHAGSLTEVDEDTAWFLYYQNYIGAEMYLVGDYDSWINSDGEGTALSGNLEGAYLTTVEPENYYGKPEASDGTTPDDTTPDEDKKLEVCMPSDGPIKIAQFADLHFGTEGSNYHNNREERTKEYMQYIVDTQDPDLIVCSGDNIMTTGIVGLKEFIELMESYETPWTFIFGNHDAESTINGYSRKSISEYLNSCDAEYLLYDTGYIDTENNRYGNFSISVLNSDGTELLGAIILMDGGTYNSSIGSYDSITEGQIAWYESEIEKLDALYNGEGTMPSVVFSHIQLPEHYTAYKAAQSNNGATFVIEQEMSSAYIESIKGGGPTKETTDFFETMKETESSVAFFCGHAHLFNFQVEMDGIVLGFGPQTGFSTLFDNNDLLRETYIYCFEEDFSFTTISCKEDGNSVGLSYTGTFDDDAEYDETTATYIASHNFNSGSYIEFSYNGVRLTTENTQIVGDFSSSTSATNKGGFFCSNGKTLYYDSRTAGTCTFTYDSVENTLTIEAEDVQVDPNAPTSMTIDAVDVDAGGDAITVWTEAGTKLKYVEDTTSKSEDWIGNNWRYYVVVDSEGRIAYAVLWPNSGYGGPMGTGYYTHPCYSDYTTNPAIVILDGFANDWSSGGYGYTQFEIVVPEGGFAITSHGTDNYELVDMLSQGTVEDYGIANINTRSLFNSNIRVKYDLDTMTVSVYTVEEDTEPEGPVVPENAGEVTYANNYDWSMQTNQIYIFASENEEATISSITGQTEDTFGWFHTVVLEENEDGTYTVIGADYGNVTGAIGMGLGEGKLVVMAHSEVVTFIDSYNWFKELAVGDVVAMNVDWSYVAASGGAFATPVYFEVVEPEEPENPDEPIAPEEPENPEEPKNPEDTTTPDTEAPKTSDSSIPAFYSLLLAGAVVLVGFGKKKRI